jgi:hypothetical protein
MENSIFHMGITTAHSYRGSLGQAQLARPMAKPLAGPCPWGTAQRVHGTEWHGEAMASAPNMASSPPTERWQKPSS